MRTSTAAVLLAVAAASAPAFTSALPLEERHELEARKTKHSMSENLADIAGHIANIGVNAYTATKMRREFPELSERSLLELEARDELEARKTKHSISENLADIAGHIANIGVNAYTATKMRREDPELVARAVLEVRKTKHSISENLADIAGHIANIGVNAYTATKMRRDYPELSEREALELVTRKVHKSISESLADIAGHITNIGINAYTATKMRRDDSELSERDVLELDARSELELRKVHKSISESLADIAGHITNIGINAYTATKMRREDPELAARAELEVRKTKHSISENLADIAGHIANIGVNAYTATKMRREDLEALQRRFVL